MNTEKDDDGDDDRRVYLYELIALHRKAYEDAIKPYVEELVRMEALRPPACYLVPTEATQSLLFLRPQGSTP